MQGAKCYEVDLETGDSAADGCGPGAEPYAGGAGGGGYPDQGRGRGFAGHRGR